MVLEDSLTLKFAALADPTRRAILLRLSRGEATVSELQAPFRISQPSTVSPADDALRVALEPEAATAPETVDA